MASATLSKLIQNDKETKQELKQINGTLQKMYSAQVTTAKNEARAAKKAAQAAKRKSGDQAMKNMFGVDKKAVDKEKKNFLQRMFEGLGGLLKGVDIGKLLLLGGVGAAIAGYFGSEKFRSLVDNYVLKPIGNFVQSTVIPILTKLVNSIATALGKTLLNNPAVNDPASAAGSAGRDAAVDIYGGAKRSSARKQLETKADQMIPKLDYSPDNGGLDRNSQEYRDTKKEYDELRRLAKLFEEKENMQEQLKRALANAQKSDNEIPWWISMGDPEGYRQRQAAAAKALQDNIDAKITQLNKETEKLKQLGIVGYESDIQKKQSGGPITVPGAGSGDKVPAVLPEGSFVLNRNAAGFQNGGLVPALLEPGEQVFGPGSWGMREMILNSAMPRFQEGGQVGGKVIEYLTGDTSHSGYRADHGGSNYHEHLAFATTAGRDRAMQILKANGIQIGSVNSGKHSPTSYHYSNQAFDVPAHQVPVGEEPALSRKVRKILAENGFKGAGIGGDNSKASPKEGKEDASMNGGGGTNGSGIDMLQGVGGWIGDFMRGITDGLTENFGDSGLGDIFKNLMGVGGGSGGGGGGPKGGTGPVDMGKDINEKLMNTAKLAMEAGFTKEQAKVMAAIAGGESSFNNRAFNGTGSDQSYGLWQINMLGAMGPERRKRFGISANEELFDPKVNAKAAKAIFDSQGYGAWGAYTDGNAAKYMNAAQALKLQNGGLVNMSGYNGGSAISQRSEDQFIEKMAAAVTPVVIPVPTGGGGTGASDVSISKGVQDVPSLPAYPDNPMALDLANRLSLGAAFA